MKKSNLLILVLLALLIALCLGYNRGWAQAPTQIVPPKVGVVNVDQILKNSRKHIQWQERMNDKEAKIRAELQKLSTEADAIKADMDTRKTGSSDYLRLMSEWMAKTATVDSRRKFYDRQMMLEIQQWTESLYQEIRSIIARTAKTRKLDIVLSADEIELPASDVRDLLTIIKTNKVLYYSDAVDITQEILAQLDSSL